MSCIFLYFGKKINPIGISREHERSMKGTRFASSRVIEGSLHKSHLCVLISEVQINTWTSILLILDDYALKSILKWKFQYFKYLIYLK